MPTSFKMANIYNRYEYLYLYTIYLYTHTHPPMRKLVNT